MIVYQVRSYTAKIDKEFDNEAAAREFAEGIGASVEMITWNVQPNLPGALPAMRYYSCALNVFEPKTGWRGVNIH